MSEEYKEWLANKGENGNALQLDLAFSTLAFTKKERGGKEEKWWALRKCYSNPPTSPSQKIDSENLLSDAKWVRHYN